MMAIKAKHRYLLSIFTGVLVLFLLIWITLLNPVESRLLLGVFFGTLVVLTLTFGFPLGGGMASLMPLSILTTYLIAGPVLAGWVAFLSAWLHAVMGFIAHQKAGVPVKPPRLGEIAVASANSVVHTLSILTGAAIFDLIGGATPMKGIGLQDVPSLVVLALTYLATNYFLVGLFTSLRGLLPLRRFIRALPQVAVYELLPLVYAPLGAMVFSQFGFWAGLVLAMALLATALVVRNLVRARERLERRVQELDSLQEVGKTLSASLDLERVMEAIYNQVKQLMPAENFFVALFDPVRDEISFPLVIENNQRVTWRTRKRSSDLTEYILQTRKPLLSRENTALLRQRIGLSSTTRQAASWLGVPILTGGDVVGVIAVQSYAQPNLYDEGHQEVLTIIAAQAGLAIQNARLYAQTDQALSRRVEQLDSTLKASREGILLLDPDFRVQAMNPAFLEFLGLDREVVGECLFDMVEDGEFLVERLGYSSSQLQNDCQELMKGSQRFKRQAIHLQRPVDLHLERTLTPVQDHSGRVTGWLLVFRDLTDEIELTRLQEEQMYLLVHDMRSPLAVVQGGLDVLKASLNEGDLGQAEQLVHIAQRGSSRVLRLVNELLDISKLESGQLILQVQRINTGVALEEILASFRSLADQAGIRLKLETASETPDLNVDPEHFTRIISNLLDNAIKFTPDGGQVRLICAPAPGSGVSMVMIQVSDSGAGIPAEARSRLFEKYRQVLTTHSRRSGTGLGLYYCKLAVEAHGGQIWVESLTGAGSTFSLRLPAAA